MQNNPSAPGDSQPPREQPSPEQGQPEAAKASSAAAPVHEAGHGQPPSGDAKDVNFDLNAVGGLNGAQRLFESDTAGRKADGASMPSSPFGQQIEWAKTQRRRQAGREPFIQWDPLTRYERGITILLERIPLQHPALGDITILCTRLSENIDHSRVSGGTPEREATRMDIIRELNNRSLMVIQVTFSQLCQVNGSEDNENGASAQKLPETQREVADWYTKLSWLERCHVIAVCVLQGAPAHEVSRAANELYALIEQAYPAGPAASNRETVGPVFVSSEDLLTHTHTVTRKLEGAERILWRDEAFDPHVREFLARQATTVGMRFADQNLLDILQSWAVSDDEERALRAARMLAELWWRQHQDKLLELAELWAASDEPQIWQGGAALLYGAYAAERAERPNMKVADSHVLRRLREWADWRDDAELALVAAYAYGLLGRQWPDIALDGLDHLLCLGIAERKNNTAPPLPVLFLAMLSYVELAASGQIRPLLTRFASHATHYTLHARDKGHGLLEPMQSRGAREQSLDMLYFHFVFLAALSLSGVRKGSAHMPYLITAGLHPRPDMPSGRGQDVLLAGILSRHEPEWRASLQTLLCAAISTGREQLAFDLLSSWIHIVTFEPRADAIEALRRFVVDVYEQLGTWDTELQKSGIRTGSSLLKQRLHFWAHATHENVLRPFAQHTLDALQQ
jgi:hypothetical protein